jgi:hypothetical protein
MGVWVLTIVAGQLRLSLHRQLSQLFGVICIQTINTFEGHQMLHTMNLFDGAT